MLIIFTKRATNDFHFSTIFPIASMVAYNHVDNRPSVLDLHQNVYLVEIDTAHAYYMAIGIGNER